MPDKKQRLSPAPSWMDRYFDWVEKLPIPPLAFYFVLYLFVVGLHHVLLWSAGALPWGEFSQGILFTVYMWAFLQMAAFHYFRDLADQAILRFKPALKVNLKEFEDIRFSFVHLDARKTLFATVFVSLFTVLSVYVFPTILTPLFFATLAARLLAWVVLFFGSPFAFAFFYFVFRSLVWVNRIFDKVKHINLFNLGPLYFLSQFTSRVGMLFLLYLVLNFLTTNAWGSEQSGEAITLFYLVANTLIALLAFLVPLWEIHLRLGAEKERVSEENNQRLDAAFWQLQRRMDKGKLDDIAQFRNGISALMDFRTEIRKISTWPWDTGTLRTFLTALLVPMTVWIVQQVLLRTVVK